MNRFSYVNWKRLCSDKKGGELTALSEARLAIEKIVIGKKQSVELLCRLVNLRKLQHELIDSYNLRSRSFGEEPNRRLRIYPN